MTTHLNHLPNVTHKVFHDRCRLGLLYLLFSAVLFLPVGGAHADDDVLSSQINEPTMYADSRDKLATPHNVLLIIGDDMGVEMLERYGAGDDYPPTPNINQLFDQGVFFRHAWAAPICSPTRATMLTGRYGFRTGVGTIVGGTDGGTSLRPQEFTLPEALQTDVVSGYATANIGKWHLTRRGQGLDMPNQMGYDHYSGVFTGGLGNYESWTKTMNGVDEQVTNYATTENVDDAIAWLNIQNNAQRPWFLWLAFNAPHTPFHKPPDETLHSFDHLPGDQADIDANPFPYYKAAIEAMDSEIGRLLDALPPAIRDNTTIIFIGDNGTPGQVVQPPYNPRDAKGRIYEEGINVPLVIAGPKVVDPGRESTALVNSVDVYATVLELMGIDLETALPAATTLDSVSMVPYLQNIEGANQRDWIFSERFAPNAPASDGKTIRDAQFKLLRFDNGTAEFYDLTQDPFENNDLLETTLAGVAEESYCTLFQTMNDLLLSEGTAVPDLPTICDELQTPPPDGTNPTNLPIGDGRISTTTPQSGHIYVCNDNFQSGGNQQPDGPWIRADGTFDYTAKTTVEGATSWPHQLSISLELPARVIAGNALPNHTTGTFPIDPNDEAYQYDRNPNPIQPRDLLLTLPANPQIAPTPNCVPMGTIGIGLTGAVFFNGLDAWGKDAVAHEIQDTCQGHPQASGQYHYHNLTSCLVTSQASSHSALAGYALDGFGIYGHHNEDGSIVTNAHLDECHGHVHEIQWDGETKEMFHYHATYQYPYTVGCFRGTSVNDGNFAMPPSITVDNQLNGDNPFLVGETISFTIRITNTGGVTITELPLESRFSSAFITFDSASPTPTSATDGILTWTDVLASLNDADGLGIDESIHLDVAFTTEADTTLLPVVASCTESGQTPNLARAMGAIGGGITITPDTDDTACASAEILNPTGIQLADRSVQQVDDGVLVRWSTVNESNMVGFNILKSNAVETGSGSTEMIVASSAGQSTGATYQWLDAGTTLRLGDVYTLEIVNNDGTTERAVIGVATGGPIYLPLVAN